MSSGPPPTSSLGVPPAPPEATETGDMHAALPLELKQDAPPAPVAPTAILAATDPPRPAPPSDEEGATCSPSAEEKGKERAKEELLERFSCHICLEVPDEPVVTPCGHVHCWPCMHEWLVVSRGWACPVCKTALTVERLIPIYSGAGEEADPRARPIPPRPRPAATPAAATFRSPASPASSFSVQAGLFPLPGLSFGWSWPPTPSAVEEPVIALRDPHGGGGLLVAPVGGRREVDWRVMVAQQAFMVLFFAVFVAITFAG